MAMSGRVAPRGGEGEKREQRSAKTRAGLQIKGILSAVPFANKPGKEKKKTETNNDSNKSNNSPSSKRALLPKNDDKVEIKKKKKKSTVRQSGTEKKMTNMVKPSLKRRVTTAGTNKVSPKKTTKEKKTKITVEMGGIGIERGDQAVLVDENENKPRRSKRIKASTTTGLPLNSTSLRQRRSVPVNVLNKSTTIKGSAPLNPDWSQGKTQPRVRRFRGFVTRSTGDLLSLRGDKDTDQLTGQKSSDATNGDPVLVKTPSSQRNNNQKKKMKEDAKTDTDNAVENKTKSHPETKRVKRTVTTRAVV